LTGKIASIAAIYHEDITDTAGKMSPSDGYFTSIAEQTAKGWKLLSAHWSMIPAKMNTKVYIGTSLDGFIARKDGDFDWLSDFANDEAIQAYGEFIYTVDAILIGRGTFEKVLTFSSWPYTKKVFVLSNSIKEAPDAVKGKVTFVSMKPKDLLTYQRTSSHLFFWQVLSGDY
jgi:hypothetical protein